MYCEGNPIKYVDSNGKIPVPVVLIVAAQPELLLLATTAVVVYVVIVNTQNNRRHSEMNISALVIKQKISRIRYYRKDPKILMLERDIKNNRGEKNALMWKQKIS